MCRKLVYLTSFVLVLGLVLSGVANAALPGLIGWWKFDEMAGIIAFDLSGLGNDGTLGGNPRWVPGYFRGALDLGGSDYVIIDAVADDIKTDNLTLSAWIKTTQTNQGDVFGFNDTGSGHQFEFGVDNGNVWLDDGPASTFPPTVVNDNQWHMITYARDGATATIYVDGVEIATDPATGTPSTDVRVSIGQEWDGSGTSSPSNFYVGMVDDVQIYNRPLTAEEVVQVMIGLPLGASSNPSPADKATDVRRPVVFSWKPGMFADKHDVYFGTSFDDVNEAAATLDPNNVYLGRQDPDYYPLSGALDLDFGQACYWRIDEVNSPPDYTIFKGYVWSFTIELFAYPIEDIIATASSSEANRGPENTVNRSGLDENGLLHGKDGEGNMWLSSTIGAQPTWIEFQFDKVYKLHELWVWNSNDSIEPAIGFGFQNVSIEYSVNGIDYVTFGTTHEFAQAPGVADYAHNTTVDLSDVVAQYVRLTANSNWGGILPQYGLSEVRFFYLPVRARKPNPNSAATDVNPDVTLSWRAGRQAAEHDVYFSTDQRAVIDGNAPVTTVTETSYGPLSLDLGQTYYWKVNEVNDAETPSTWQGDIWDLSTQEYLVVDDFESYNDIPAGQEGSNLVYMAWKDGLDNPSVNGSTMGYNVPFQPTMETSIVYDGKQSAPLFYDNTVATYSEATANVADLAIGQDWTKHGIKTLSLWFSGDPNNAAEQMYTKVNGVKVVYDGDVADIQSASWNEWNIELASFGVNRSNVTELSIGFERIGAVGGKGMVLLDGIRLYSLRELEGDLTGN